MKTVPSASNPVLRHLDVAQFLRLTGLDYAILHNRSETLWAVPELEGVTQPRNES